MSTLSLNKMKDLWFREKKCKGAIVRNASSVVARANEIFSTYNEIRDLIQRKPNIIENDDNTGWGKYASYPQHETVKDNYMKQCGNDTDKKSLLEAIFKLCPGLTKQWDKNTSLTSSKPRYEDYEQENNNDPYYTPSSYFLSFNHPAKIARYLTNTDEKYKDNWLWWNGNDEVTYSCRFPMKYLWMLKTEAVIPILSLQSFFNLTYVFKEVYPNFYQDFSYNDSRWQQSLDDFTEKWPKVSKALCEALDVKELLPEERCYLATFLFQISLEDVHGLDAQTMLEHGNHAIILYGPPGTGKTYIAKTLARRILDIPEPSQEDKKCSAEESILGKWQIVQFHPNYTYQDFIGGIFPDVDSDDKQEKSAIHYIKQKGIFQLLCDEARKESNNSKKYILIIDEINRADLSGVFGELMYCLEYRGETVKLPLFGDFSIPENVYIIGTMNNTDKSLIGFDLALRRRFGFLKIMPDMTVLEKALPKLDRVDELKTRADNLNTNLKKELGLSEDKQIGHAYFLKIKDYCPKNTDDTIGLVEGAVPQYKDNCSKTVDDKISHVTPYALEQLWDYHIEPLLEEYLGLEFEEKKTIIEKLKSDFTMDIPKTFE